MYEFTKVVLANDLDLILAYKRSMQVADYMGIGLVQQTSFATAVSEVCRLAVDKDVQPSISLGVLRSSHNRNYVCAKILDPRFNTTAIQNPNLSYARKLVHDFIIEDQTVTLLYELPASLIISRELVSKGQKLFEEFPAVTPYEEAKRLNDQLQLMAHRLGESEKKYKLLTDSLPLLLFTVDSDGTIVFANQGFSVFSGNGFNESGLWYAWLEDRITKESLMDIQKRMHKNDSFSIELYLKKADGAEPEWYLLSMTPIENLSDLQKSWSGFLVNIHAQKLVEKTLRDNELLLNITEALETRQKELDQTVANLNRSNQELAKFAYVASHDLREPARKMAVFSDMLLSHTDQTFTEEATDILRRIRTGSGRMLAVIRDLLDYSNISFDQDLQKERLPLMEVVQLAVEQLEVQIEESASKIKVEKDFIIHAHKQLLSQLFQNLIGNSIKFVNERTVPEINISAGIVSSDDVELLGLDKSLEWTFIHVKDNGIGFDQKFSEKIFEMFQRLHGQTEYQGTGIGLAICKRIIEMHNGHIKVNSKLGEGSVFTVYLPHIQPSQG